MQDYSKTVLRCLCKTTGRNAKIPDTGTTFRVSHTYFYMPSIFENVVRITDLPDGIPGDTLFLIFSAHHMYRGVNCQQNS